MQIETCTVFCYVMCTVVSSNVCVIKQSVLFKYTLLGLWIVFISLLLYRVLLSCFLDLHLYDPVFSIYSFADWYEIMVIFCIYHLTWIANWNMYCFLLCSVFCINSVLCSIKLCVIKKSVFFNILFLDCELSSVYSFKSISSSLQWSKYSSVLCHFIWAHSLANWMEVCPIESYHLLQAVSNTS